LKENNKGEKFEIKRYFTKEGSRLDDLFKETEWETRDALIKGNNGEIIFEQKGVIFPKFWSDNAVNIFASRYFFGKEDSPLREFSLADSVYRVVCTISRQGADRGYFSSAEERITFEAELGYLLINQMFSFNSPVWFSVGTSGRQTVSACYILGVEDELESILENINTAGKIYRDGSGCGFNASHMRSRHEGLSNGGKSSGPISFMRIFDEVAKTIKSGGKKRRSATLVCMNIDHPEIEDFIEIKSREEKKAKILIENGYDPSLGGEAYESVSFQNENHSVMITDAFMAAVKEDRDWHLLNKNGESVKTVKARYLFRLIAQNAWETGDPGVQFYDTINQWDTCKEDPPIESSNPCGEFLFKNFTSCNLASFNVRHFYARHTPESFFEALKLAVVAMNILIDFGEFPTPKITEMTREYRPIGIGMCDIGGYLMSRGIPFASLEGLQAMSSMMALITLGGYYHSCRLGEKLGRTFPALKRNEESVRDVLAKHFSCYEEDLSDIWKEGYGAPINVREIVQKIKDYFTKDPQGIHSLLNAQISTLAPTGTTGIAMDSSTTGIEPELSLIKYKHLSGGGVQKYVNPSLKEGLEELGYPSEEIKKIEEGLEGDNPELLCRPEHRHVFATSLGGAKNVPVITPLEHLATLEALQPFVSGGISKTVNIPNDWSVEQIEDLFIETYNRGLKSITVYRDGSKGNQPLTTKQIKAAKPTQKEEIKKDPKMHKTKKRLPDTRKSLTHRVLVNGHKCYFHAGLYEDGSLGDIFISMSNEGSFANGLMATLGRLISLAIQWGVPIGDILRNLKNAKFEPAGVTSNKEIQFCSSVVDYLGKWIEANFVPSNLVDNSDLNLDNFATGLTYSNGPLRPPDAPVRPPEALSGSICATCGSILIRDGGCLLCPLCGANDGCGG